MTTFSKAGSSFQGHADTNNRRLLSDFLILLILLVFHLGRSNMATHILRNQHLSPCNRLLEGFENSSTYSKAWDAHIQLWDLYHLSN